MRAVVVGGTGLVGRAISRRLLAAGWQVDVVARGLTLVPADLRAEGVRLHAVDRADLLGMRAAMGTGADLLVDCGCFTAAQATAILPLAQQAASTVMISTKAVYVDAAGRHSKSPEPPQFDGPIAESQPTVAPGDMDFNSREGYARNKIAAEQVLLDSGLPVTVLRPSKIHGEGAVPPREWVFVKRVLDRRPAVLLARGGTGVDHTTAAVNLAALVEVVAAKPGARILNSADPDAPSGLQIARAVAGHLGHRWEEVLLGPDDAGLGEHPWDRVPPIILDVAAATELGYVPVGDYAATVGLEIDWLVAMADQVPWQEAPFFSGYFDYPAEDRFLAERSAT